jgi:hypothetical protein
VWSVNPVFQTTTDPTLTASQCLTIASAINAITIGAGILDMMGSQTFLTGCRVESRSRSGVLEAQAEAPRGSPVAGSGGATHPNQLAVVASLRSGFPGGQGRGRLYFPATGTSLVPSTARIATSSVSGFVAAVKTLLSGIETAITTTAGPTDLVIWSRTGTAFHAVTGIRAGDVPDVQRRRRDALAEVYSPVAYP